MKRNEGEIRGLPTLMAIYPAKLDHSAVRDSLRTAGYAERDVLVYYRLKGTDQVVYADSGRIAPGQALEEAHLTPQALSHVETVVLVHPQDGRVQEVETALRSLGVVQIMFEGATIVEGRETGETPEGGLEEQKSASV